MTPQDKWKECCRILGDNLSYAEYEDWIKPIRFLSYEDNELRLSVPSFEFKDHIEETYLPVLAEVLRSVFGPEVKLFYHSENLRRKKN